MIRCAFALLGVMIPFSGFACGAESMEAYKKRVADCTRDGGTWTTETNRFNKTIHYCHAKDTCLAAGGHWTMNTSLQAMGPCNPEDNYGVYSCVMDFERGEDISGSTTLPSGEVRRQPR